MSLPILFVQGASTLPLKPVSGPSRSDRSAFDQALGNAQRQASKPKAPATDEPKAADQDAPKVPEAKDEKVADQPSADHAKADQKGHADAKQDDAKTDDQKQASPQQPAVVDLQAMMPVVNQLVVPQVAKALQAAAPEVAQAVAALAPGKQQTMPAAMVAAIAQAQVPAQPQATPATPTAPEKASAQPAADVTKGAVENLIQQGVTQADANGSQPGNQQGEQGSNGQEAPKPPVMPVASQQAPQSVETLRAIQNMTSLKAQAAQNQAQPTQAQAPVQPPLVASAAKPQEVAAKALVEEVKSAEPAPAKSEQADQTAPTVQPWELPHPVHAPEQALAHAQVLDQGAVKGDPQPVHEAIRTPFLQAASENRPSELRLQLSPDNLGRVDIRVIAHEGALSAHIRVDHAQTRDLMQVQLAELRQNLADQGIKIDRLEVNVGGDRQPSGFDLSGQMMQQQQQQQQQQAAQSGTRNTYSRLEGGEVEHEEAPGEARPAAQASAGAVDYQA